MESKALPPKGHYSVPATRLSGRVCARLERAEACEPNPHYRDDLQIARLTVLYAASGEAVLCSPHVLASYTVLGLHPDRVWPAIQERQRALLGSEKFSGGKLPPKKPPVAAVGLSQQKLWCENTNGAEATNSRAALNERFSANPVELMGSTAAVRPTAALYRNPEPHPSGKRGYSLAEMLAIVDGSGAPHSVRALTISALLARGEWPNEDGPATTALSVAILGMMLEDNCCRSTVQRRIKRAMKDSYWRRVRSANSWTDCPKCHKARTSGKCDACPYRGRSKDDDGNWTGEFMRVPVYEFDIQKFRTAPRCREIRHFDARTYAEYKAAAKRGEQLNVVPWRKPSQPDPNPPAPPPATAAPVKQPAAEHAHRNTARPEPKPQPKLSKRECAKFVADMAVLMKGHTRHVESVGGYGFDLPPDDMRYRPKFSWDAALAATCERWHRTEESVREALKLWGYKPPEES